ncbi:MAG: NAD(P)H-dependent oxidoreductase [Aerococcus sp.]|nr:NAD(P)H-dependent oxidoreductase [Aerococcus sp.]
MKFLGIVGTNADYSLNRILLQYMQKHFAENATIEIAEIKDIPMFNAPADHQLPARITEIKEQIEDSDAVIIATPEYDHSIPAALKNVLEWLSYGIKPLWHKPVMIVGASYGLLGSSRAQLFLHQILASPEIGAYTLSGTGFLLGRAKDALDDEGNLINEEAVERLERYFGEFSEYVVARKGIEKMRELINLESR